MEFERLTADFGEAAGIDARPDAQGTAWIDSDGVMVTVQHRPEHDDMVIFSLPLSGEAADELHLRAFLAALIAEKGPVPLSEFSTRIMFLGEKSIQNRKDAFLGTPLDPPKNPMSGQVFAAAAMKAYKAMEDPELHSQSAG